MTRIGGYEIMKMMATTAEPESDQLYSSACDDVNVVAPSRVNVCDVGSSENWCYRGPKAT
ncbi:hypothetical protein U9M48_028577 [Paspalum notatum var. saurae]|uniref:Uncharacterized protein n=1 Tax=Paspalum notatum var. saurae TaxID=547442 RepID=A0AAQ3TWZ7_PASNO